MNGLRLCSGLGSALLLCACASTSAPEKVDYSSGIERVSPVRAAEINTRLGNGYFERGQLQDALEKLETALRHDPDHVPAHLTLAMIYERLGNDQAAENHFQRAVRLAPGDGATQNHFGAFLCRRGEFQNARNHFNIAIDDPFYRTPEVALANAGVCARRGGRIDLAEQYLRRALEVDPEFPDPLFQLADIYLQKGDAFRARAFLQRLEAATPPDASTLLLGFQIESALGNPLLANRYAGGLERDFPDSREAEQMRRTLDGAQ